MTEKQLKKLRRKDLLELLLSLRKENDQLQSQLEATRQQLAQTRSHLDAQLAKDEASARLSAAVARLDQITDMVEQTCRDCSEQIQAQAQPQPQPQPQPQEKAKGPAGQVNIVMNAEDFQKIWEPKTSQKTSATKPLPLKFWKRN